jgi:hypothetical protein
MRAMLWPYGSKVDGSVLVSILDDLTTLSPPAQGIADDLSVGLDPEFRQTLQNIGRPDWQSLRLPNDRERIRGEVLLSTIRCRGGTRLQRLRRAGNPGISILVQSQNEGEQLFLHCEPSLIVARALELGGESRPSLDHLAFRGLDGLKVRFDSTAGHRRDLLDGLDERKGHQGTNIASSHHYIRYHAFGDGARLVAERFDAASVRR